MVVGDGREGKAAIAVVVGGVDGDGEAVLLVVG